MTRVLIMAGGTGGHVYPALAVADELKRRGAEIAWMGTAAGLEARVVPQAGYRLLEISIAGLRGKGVLSWVAAPWRLLRAIVQATRIVRRESPSVVIGLGGFASGPGGLAARLLRKPLVVHEQNAAAGLTNRLLARIASVVLQAFPATFEGEQVRTVGNPVRRDILDITPPSERLRGRDGPIRLLVLGGSLGALAINELVPAALARMPIESRPQVRHQAGRTFDVAEKAYAEHAVAGEVTRYIEDMAGAYGWADLVLCRSGALTVAELAAAGLPAVLIPFPFAVDDHQTHNGNYLVEREAALMIQQRDLDAQRLESTLRELCADRERLATMADRARQAAWPQATDQITDICLEFAEVAA